MADRDDRTPHVSWPANSSRAVPHNGTSAVPRSLPPPPVIPPLPAPPSTIPPAPVIPPPPPPPNGQAWGVPASLRVPPPPPAPTAPLDYAQVRGLRERVSKLLTEALRDSPNMSPEHRRAVGEQVTAKVVGEHINLLMEAGSQVTGAQEKALMDAVAADMFGLGRLQTLLDRTDIVNIHILGCDQVRIEHTDGKISTGAPVADSDEELVEMLQILAMRATSTERSLSASKPWLDMQLPDGSRLTVVHQVSVRPTVTIRRHTLMDVSLEDLRDRYGVMDELICGFLKAAMGAGLNIMVAGLADAGKTTLLRALAHEIPQREQFVVLEESRELGLHTLKRHPWAISMEAREGHGVRGTDGRPAGEVNIADLIPLTLRMSVQRIIVGEVRSREIVPMLQAMATSKGSMCTIHARNARSVGDRIVELALQHGKEMTADLARRMAAGAIDLIVYVTVDDETKLGGRKLRYISEIVEVGGMADNRLVTTTIFGPGRDGRAIPRHQPERLQPALLRAGYDPRHLIAYTQQGDANEGAWTHSLQRVGRQS